MRQINRNIIIVLLLISFATSSYAIEFESGTDISTGGAVNLSSISASSMLNLPLSNDAGLYHFESGYSRAFGIKELDNIFVAGSARDGQLNIAIGYSQLGETDYYAEQLFKTNLSYKFSKYLFSIAVSKLHFEFGNDFDGIGKTTFGSGVGANFKNTIIAISADNLFSDETNIIDGIQRQLSINVDQSIAKGSRFLFSCKFEQGESPIFGLGQVIELSNRGSVEYGVGTSPLRLGGGVSFAIKNSLISLAFSRHPVLGLSKAISISYIFKKAKADKSESIE